MCMHCLQNQKLPLRSMPAYGYLTAAHGIRSPPSTPKLILTPTVGVGGFFMALDMNFSWSDIAELEKPAYAFVFGPRLGKNITFKNPERSLAIWAGGFRIKLNSGTSGSLSTA